MEKIVDKFKGQLVKIIKDSGAKFDDYSVSSEIRWILLDWGYELKKEDLLLFSLIKIFVLFFFCFIKDELLSI